MPECSHRKHTYIRLSSRMKRLLSQSTERFDTPLQRRSLERLPWLLCGAYRKRARAKKYVASLNIHVEQLSTSGAVQIQCEPHALLLQGAFILELPILRLTVPSCFLLHLCPAP